MWDASKHIRQIPSAYSWLQGKTTISGEGQEVKEIWLRQYLKISTEIFGPFFLKHPALSQPQPLNDVYASTAPHIRSIRKESTALTWFLSLPCPLSHKTNFQPSGYQISSEIGAPASSSASRSCSSNIFDTLWT
jgi:hypothetical protein